MKELDNLLVLIEKAEWASHVYKEAGEAYHASYQRFTQAAVHPRNRTWRSDALILSLLKHCDIQGLTLQGINKITKMVSSDLDKAIKAAQAHLREAQAELERMEREMREEFQKVQKAVQKRCKALGGAGDVWKADFDLKKEIRVYVSKESKLRLLEQKAKSSHQQAHDLLLKAYYRTLNEYMACAAGHLNILSNDVSEHVGPACSSKIPKSEPCLETPTSLSMGTPTETPDLTLEQLEKTRFGELYSQALREARGKAKADPAGSLAVRGCGLFIVPKISSDHLLFVVCTSTDYLHAFSIQPILNKISTDLFMEDSECPVKALQRTLSTYSEPEIEKINSYLLSHIGDLSVIEKVFPINLKNMRVSMRGGGCEMLITEAGAMFFAKQVKVQAGNVQQMRKFYSLVKEEACLEAAHAHSSDETGARAELPLSWSPATYENPW
ncbi:uncharacterized protein NEMAJ01_0096 [Nematocida major]|uniref:uncharacterized protein n=1 Tax=Nematocida major TaxID=1912982 RepID=UPI0020078F9B|nr:uncharacterized protein NEMAJ01_0096 [Nematocida major]KAH9385200.1 hypothetical protein NEMAJ01_0096 [Nematocida major]